VGAAPGTPAHNALRWAPGWRAARALRATRRGGERLVRDASGSRGLVAVDRQGRVLGNALNRADRLARLLLAALRALPATARGAATVGEA
jgi:hypothetical protein